MEYFCSTKPNNTIFWMMEFERLKYHFWQIRVHFCLFPFAKNKTRNTSIARRRFFDKISYERQASHGRVRSRSTRIGGTLGRSDLVFVVVTDYKRTFSRVQPVANDRKKITFCSLAFSWAHETIHGIGTIERFVCKYTLALSETN